MFRFIVLGLLLDGAPRHGYALTKLYRARFGTRVNTGNFYRELRRLVADGLVRTAGRAPDGDPRRAPYVITETGAAAFRRWFEEPRVPRAAAGLDDQLAARMAFLVEVPPDVATRVLSQWKEVSVRRTAS